MEDYPEGMLRELEPLATFYETLQKDCWQLNKIFCSAK